MIRKLESGRTAGAECMGQKRGITLQDMSTYNRSDEQRSDFWGYRSEDQRLP